MIRLGDTAVDQGMVISGLKNLLNLECHNRKSPNQSSILSFERNCAEMPVSIASAWSWLTE